MPARRCTYLDWPRVNQIFEQELPQVDGSERSYMLRSLFSGTWIWELENKILGFAVIDSDKYPTVSWLEYLAVDSAAQGKGIGSRLMSHCEALAKNAGKDWLGLSAFRSNERAVGFYMSLGYAPSKDPVEGKIMFSKPLGGATALPPLHPHPHEPNALTMGLRRVVFNCMCGR